MIKELLKESGHRKTIKIGSPRRGFTLIELLMLIIIIGVIAGVTMKSLTPNIRAGKTDVTRKEMENIAKAIMNYTRDVGAAPSNLTNLVTNLESYATWKGPYLINTFDQDTADYHRDGWNTLYTYVASDSGVCLTSAGSGSNVTRRIASAHTDLDSNTVQGAIRDIANATPGTTYGDSINIKITYPDKVGSTTTQTTHPTQSGVFSFNGIPIGTHTIEFVYLPTHDTIITYATVSAKLTATSNAKFGRAIWKAANAGTPPAGGTFEYVTSSASAYGNCVAAAQYDSVQFAIKNNTGSSINFTWLEATYDGSAAYYKKVYWSGTKVCSSATYYSSGNRATFSSSQDLADGAQVTIYLKKFPTTNSCGACLCRNYAADMRSRTFSIKFSNDSTITFGT
ncbi:MAG: type II secretion system protein GspG [candidate division Zixibacteria bacterium]|nr:type II secretion system protein GspG [candidate division Zixibacteria bacterium]